MEHPASLSSPQPWRLAAIVAAALAALELFVLVIVGIAFFTKILADDARQAGVPAAAQTAAVAGNPDASAATGARTGTKGEATAPGPLLPRGETSVIVLNGNGVPGAAGTAADRVRRLQYLIAGTGNAPHTSFRRSVVMFRPGRQGEAARLAQDLKIKRVLPLDGMKPKDLQGAHLALILGG